MKIRYIECDGKIETPGIDYGPQGLQLIHSRGDFRVVKQPGHTAWASVGQQEYYPTSYHLMWVIDKDFAKDLGEVEAGRHWRRAVDYLKYLTRVHQFSKMTEAREKRIRQLCEDFSKG